jgi:hypothetical protein
MPPTRIVAPRRHHCWPRLRVGQGISSKILHLQNHHTQAPHRKSPASRRSRHADHATGMRGMSTLRQPKRTASIPLDTDHHTCSYATERSSTNTTARRQLAVFQDMPLATLLGLSSVKRRLPSIDATATSWKQTCVASHHRTDPWIAANSIVASSSQIAHKRNLQHVHPLTRIGTNHNLPPKRRDW